MFYMGLVTTIFRSKNWKCSPVIFASLSPNTPHAISVFSDDCIVFNIILRTSTFETAFFGTLSENDVLSDFFMRMLYHSPTHLTLSVHMVITNYLIMSAMLMKNYWKPSIQNRMLNSIIDAFFITLLRNHGANVIVPSLAEDDQNENLIFILKYIQEHFATVTLKELSSFFNYSERQLQRIIKSSTGMSFSENIQQLRMNQATRLLTNPDISIAVISEELGYSDIGNFRQAFKKCFGMTPLEYRNRTR